MTAKNNHTIFATRERTLAKKSNKKNIALRWQSNERNDKA